jgi:hypothetical protein
VRALSRTQHDVSGIYLPVEFEKLSFALVVFYAVKWTDLKRVSLSGLISRSVNTVRSVAELISTVL